MSESLNGIIVDEPIRRIQRELRQQQVLDAFGRYISESEFNNWYLSLYRFATNRPLKYLRDNTIEASLDFLNAHPQATLEAITTYQQELTHALLSLFRPASSWEHEDHLSLDAEDDRRDFQSRECATFCVNGKDR